MILEFEVNNQKLKRLDKNYIVDKSVNYLYARFDFETDDWSTCDKIATFKAGKTVYEEPLNELNDFTCPVPWEVLCESNYFLVSVVGLDEAIDTRITTNTVQAKLNASEYVEEKKRSGEHTPDVFSMIFKLLRGKFTSVELKNDELLFYNKEDKLLARVDLCIYRNLPESDPVFRSSAASTISIDDIRDWNNKYDAVELKDDKLIFKVHDISRKTIDLDNYVNLNTVLRLLENYYTQYEVNEKLSEKQDVLVDDTSSDKQNLKKLRVKYPKREEYDEYRLIGKNTVDIELPDGNVKSDWEAEKDSDSEIINKPDLTVYAKTDDVTEMINEAIRGVSQFKYEIVEELPPISEAEKGVIYLKKDTSAATEKYDMFLLIGDEYKNIGSSSVDLSAYDTRDQTLHKMLQLANSLVKKTTYTTDMYGINADLNKLFLEVGNDFQGVQLFEDKLIFDRNNGTTVIIDLDDIMEESDPIFKRSPAHNIEEEDIDSWNNKISRVELEDTTLNFYSKNSLKASINLKNLQLKESDPIFCNSPAYDIKAENIDDWNNKFDKVNLDKNQLIFYTGDTEKARININTLTEESDPVFCASEAAKLREGELSLFRGKIDDLKMEGNELKFYSDDVYKGCVVLQGINAESDPVFCSSPAHSITDKDIKAWNNQVSSNDLDTLLVDLIGEINSR